MRDFLINKGKFYCPPLKDLTGPFCKVFNKKLIDLLLFLLQKILRGEKKLLKLIQVNWVENVPNWK